MRIMIKCITRKFNNPTSEPSAIDDTIAPIDPDNNPSDPNEEETPIIGDGDSGLYSIAPVPRCAATGSVGVLPAARVEINQKHRRLKILEGKG